LWMSKYKTGGFLQYLPLILNHVHLQLSLMEG
jgi:hypothetical protein